MNESKKIIAFCCQNSAGRALADLRKKQIPLPSIIRCILVPCLERVNPDLIINTFQDGIIGVLLIGCKNGCCSNLYGNERARVRVADIKRLLNSQGSNRVIIESYAVDPSESTQLVEIFNTIIN